jgi:16S rRNA (guanine966-N2)-methyltransferase
MTRIIGGSAGGRRLATPRGQNTRPTSDRVREALFSAIEAWCGSLDGLRFLDLYAGSGAIGLEARSRGAGVVTLVESDRRTAKLINDNVGTLRFTHTEVISTTVAATLLRTPAAPYDVVFLDPPYPLGNDAVEGDLAHLVRNGWLANDALVVVERASRGAGFTWPDGFVGWREKKYGETVLRYGRAARPKAASDVRPSTGVIIEE